MTRVRYAPAPTGLLHIGNARPAVLNWLFARKHGADYVLRFDDTDLERSTENSVASIREDLAWLGIAPTVSVRQSERTALYDDARDQLVASGRLYPAYETADELERRRARARAHHKPPIYDRAALALTDADRIRLESEGRRPHWRFRLEGRIVRFTDLIKGEQAIDTASMSDPVLIREDGSFLYTLPSVVDDIDLGITHVIRGEDHVSNTGTQIELFEALGGALPAFAHHNLLTGPDGEGLSKRLGSLALAEFRTDGFEGLAVALMAALIGTSLPVAPWPSLDALAAGFDLSVVSLGPARYDPAELAGLNARLLHSTPFEAVRPRLSALGVDDEALWLALRGNLARFGDIADLATLVRGPVTPIVDDADRPFLAEARRLLPPEPWDASTWGTWTAALKAATGRSGKALFLPLRMALTGRHDGPELKAMLPLLGRRACLDRLS